MYIFVKNFLNNRVYPKTFRICLFNKKLNGNMDKKTIVSILVQSILIEMYCIELHLLKVTQLDISLH
jgi:hypothetical protein